MMTAEFSDSLTEEKKLAHLNCEKLADDIYQKSLDMALAAGSTGSHIGGSFSCIEIFAVLYGQVLRYDPDNPLWDGRDRFIASKAHCVLSHFSALCLAGYFPESELMSFRQDGGFLCGHPYNPMIGLEYSGGSLGMGISVGIGMAIAAKKDRKEHGVYVLLGDGELNEGSCWEAFMSAGQYKLDNLTVIIDYNNMQFDDTNDKIMSLSPLDEKLEAFGFRVSEVDGHDIPALTEAFATEHEGRPLAVIAHTIKAKGIERLENRPESHQTTLTKSDYDAAVLKGRHRLK